MTATTDVELSPEQALAKRWLRTSTAPLEVWQWLGGRAPGSPGQIPAGLEQPVSGLLKQSLRSLGQPLASYSNEHERQTLEDCLNTVAAILTLCHTQMRGPALASGERMLAACVLPLYRGLARGSIIEVTSVLRRQLADALAIANLVHEFQDDLAALLASAMSSDESPYATIQRVLQVDVEVLSQLLLHASQKWDGQDGGLLHQLVCDETKVDWRPAWGAPSVLWRLAGELIAERAEFVVPRDWISVPVPWNEASEHWRDIVHALLQTPLTTAKANRPVATDQSGQPTNQTTEQATAQTTGQTTGQSTGPAATQSADLTRIPAEASGATPAMPPAAMPSSDEDIERLKLEIEIADSVDELLQSSRQATGRAVGNRTDKGHPAETPRPRGDEFVVPKIIIAEVRSHNDPAFITVVRRQLAVCRSEERTMSLIAVCVQPDGDEENMPTLQSLGLATWQQKLVNWMSEHPEIHDPYAFVSNEGELILSLMDIERNTATGLLRQGLIEVLSGQSASGDVSAMLSRVTIPARYYSGIGSASAPTAGFEPEQLIEATYRCLAAAQRHGKASIKSIEVF
ncbi:MAG: hypothetical protein IT423_01270 [Pirellulaceae bacterium]|nr:hypothetical protein [Pirellulaceae bacterium]